MKIYAWKSLIPINTGIFFVAKWLRNLKKTCQVEHLISLNIHHIENLLK
jgi:hypothetical protein